MHVIPALGLGAALTLGGGLFADSQPQALPRFAASHAGGIVPGTPAPLLPVRGDACGDNCPDCTDCPTEIDIVPYHREDPIGHAIKRLPPPPSGECEPGPDPYAEKARQYPDTMGICGIRCWYWRLRHGYCGPGCDYYRYRMHTSNSAGPRHPRHACRS